MMDYYSLNKREASPEVTQEKYREEAEFVMNRRAQETNKTVKVKSKKARRSSQEKISKMKMTMMIATSDPENVHANV